MKIELLLGTLDTFPCSLTPHFEARKKVFVDQLKWNLPEYSTGQDVEIDRFDSVEGTTYGYFKIDGELVYSVRFLPAEESMLMALWPDAYNNLAFTGKAVEMSRFVSHTKVPSLHFTSAFIQIVFGVLHSQGYRNVIGTMDKRVMRLYKVLSNKPTQELFISNEIRAGYWVL